MNVGEYRFNLIYILIVKGFNFAYALVHLVDYTINIDVYNRQLKQQLFVFSESTQEYLLNRHIWIYRKIRTFLPNDVCAAIAILHLPVTIIVIFFQKCLAKVRYCCVFVIYDKSVHFNQQNYHSFE